MSRVWMKINHSSLPLCLFLAIFLIPSDGRAESPELSGFLEVDKRAIVSDGLSNGDTFGKLRLEVKHDVNPNLFLLAGAEIRYYDFPVLEDLPSAGEIEGDYPVDVMLWEAYIELSPFVSENLDLKIGRQRIAWGTADAFNPTDNLNPNDLTDFLDFEEKIPSLALKGSYYYEDYTITGVWLPLFEPALLPRGGTLALLGQMPLTIEEPARTLDNGMFALKLSGTVHTLDTSLSYFKGFDDFPIRLDASGLRLGFPEIQVLG
ncbi:MAG: DUF1302 family protein, partial [Desulfatiglandales bacterium]